MSKDESMKTLLLMRHGKSSWDNIDLSDHERPLKKRGKRDARRMGDVIISEDLIPDIVLSSTANRAKSTAYLVSESFDLESDIQLHPSLYHGSLSDYFDLISSLDDFVKIVMIIGHNPDLEEILLELTDINESLPTSALAQIEFDIDHWSELNNGIQGTLVGFWYPRGLSH